MKSSNEIQTIKKHSIFVIWEKLSRYDVIMSAIKAQQLQHLKKQITTLIMSSQYIKCLVKIWQSTVSETPPPGCSGRIGQDIAASGYLMTLGSMAGMATDSILMMYCLQSFPVLWPCPETLLETWAIGWTELNWQSSARPWRLKPPCTSCWCPRDISAVAGPYTCRPWTRLPNPGSLVKDPGTFRNSCIFQLLSSISTCPSMHWPVTMKGNYFPELLIEFCGKNWKWSGIFKSNPSTSWYRNQYP